MTLNPNQGKLMSLHRRRDRLLSWYAIDDIPVELVHTYKYLRTTLCSDLSWHAPVTYVISPWNKTFGFSKTSFA